ncbi:hypothetical protein ID866_10841 [Astraeus odoratus]|nr:hypothetical protein ID866_10841 [Astraeus odoratus]
MITGVSAALIGALVGAWWMDSRKGKEIRALSEKLEIAEERIQQLAEEEAETYARDERALKGLYHVQDVTLKQLQQYDSDSLDTIYEATERAIAHREDQHRDLGG